MTILFFALAALLGTALGAALVWAVIDRRSNRDIAHAVTSPATVPTERLPFAASIDELAHDIDGLLASSTELRLIGIYAGRETDETLEARWRAGHLEAGYLPLTAPTTILLQIDCAWLVDHSEIGSGLKLALGAAAPDVEAKLVAQEHAAEVVASTAALNENPFEIDDDALTQPLGSPYPRTAPTPPPPLDRSSLAARIVAAPWRGPYGWRGLIVAQPVGEDRGRDLSTLDGYIEEFGVRIGVLSEVSLRSTPPPAAPLVVPVTEAPPEHRAPIILPESLSTPSVPEAPIAPARLQRATARVAEALMAPRRVRDVVKNTIGLLADGLATDRSYAIQVEGLHTMPVELEKRSEAAASAIGINVGMDFINAIRSRIGPTISAITLDAHSANEFVPEHVRTHLGSVSRMIIPVLDKGRIVIVFVAEWIDLSKVFTPDDVGFAEKVVNRTAVARERVLQFDALAEQAAHARSEQEQVSDALQQLQSVIAALPEAVIGLDSDGKVTFANQSAARLLGRMEFELMGRLIHEAAATLGGGDIRTWEHVMMADAPKCFTGAFRVDRFSIDVTVVPGLDSGVCDRLVSLREVLASSRTNGHDASVASHGTVMELADRLGRLLGGLELIAGGAYGELNETQTSAILQARRLATELRTRLDDVLRSI